MPISRTRPARAGSVRVAAWQRQRLGDADRRRIMEAARRLERRTHQRGMHGGALRRTGILVLWTLLYRGPSRHGVCDPSIGQLAEWSGVARSTVQLAIARIEAAGIMGHVRRGIVVTVRGAAKWAQWTSAYLFASPSCWCDTEGRSPEVSMKKKKAQERQEEGQGSAMTAAERALLAAKWGLAITNMEELENATG
jgi:DNA-binding MarR family transcriptional regulator